MFFPTSPATLASSNASGGVAALRRVAHPLAALIAITALSGDTPAGPTKTMPNALHVECEAYLVHASKLCLGCEQSACMAGEALSPGLWWC